MAYDHIVFDLDGTLVDSLADLTAAVNHVRRGVGLPPLPPDRIATYVGEGVRVLVRRALGPRGGPGLAEGLASFMTYYGRHLLDHTQPYPGIVAALAGLAARGVTLSVLSNKPAALSRTIVSGLRLSRYFRAVLGGDSCAMRKPDRAGLERLRTRAGTPPARMLLVGDSAIDLRTARAGGVAFCGVAWGFNHAALRAAAPERIIAHPGELLALVDGERRGSEHYHVRGPRP
jgi:phosphoglycolate phosphatase